MDDACGDPTEHAEQASAQGLTPRARVGKLSQRECGPPVRKQYRECERDQDNQAAYDLRERSGLLANDLAVSKAPEMSLGDLSRRNLQPPMDSPPRDQHDEKQRGRAERPSTGAQHAGGSSQLVRLDKRHPQVGHGFRGPLLEGLARQLIDVGRHQVEDVPVCNADDDDA